MSENKNLFSEALDFHQNGRAGKIETVPTKPLETQKDLSLAYSPGVASPCLEIQKDEDKSYSYTSKGNLVAVVSNGTAVLGLGDIGASASKPVMEGKAVLFKKFADVDAIDLEINSKNPDEVVLATALVSTGFGGINLEDIKAPECFYIEQKLRERLNIPVFHDDQHGTAVVVCAALLNGLKITGKKIKDIKVVVNGAGAAAIACSRLLKSFGVQTLIMCDTKGVVYKERTENMNPYKKEFAFDTPARTLNEALVDADVFLGLSVKDALSPEALKTMAKDPMVFALANPNPEIAPEIAKKARPDVIMATGRSDYPNQINNLLGFPYIFRGALDVRATTINEDMKKAAALALAQLAQEPVSQKMKDIYKNKDFSFGKEYILPVPFDDRLIKTVPVAVAKAAVEGGVARAPVKDWGIYEKELQERLTR